MSTPSTNRLLEELGSARELPTIPAVLVPLLKCMKKTWDAVDMHQVVQLISQDKSLAARSPQVANSPLFGWSHQVEAYAAGLLHDVGIVALLWVSPHEFRRSIEQARADRVPLHIAEETVLGVTHCEAGKIIATSWHLPPELIEVIACHHAPALATANRALTGLVSVSDLLCRLGGLGYGYREDHETNFAEDPGFTILAGHYPAIRPFDLARFTFEMGAVLEEVQAVVSRVYGIAQ